MSDNRGVSESTTSAAASAGSSTDLLIQSLEQRMIDRQNVLFERFMEAVKSSNSAPKTQKPTAGVSVSTSVSHSVPQVDVRDKTVDTPRDCSSPKSSKSSLVGDKLGLLMSEGSEPEDDGNDNTTLANKLASGESSYDWDVMGYKDVIHITQGSSLQTAVESVNRSADKVGSLMSFPMSLVESEDCQSGLLNVPLSSRETHTLFPIPDSFRKLWDASRSSTSVSTGSIVPPQVRRTYKLPPED